MTLQQLAWCPPFLVTAGGDLRVHARALRTAGQATASSAGATFEHQGAREYQGKSNIDKCGVVMCIPEPR